MRDLVFGVQAENEERGGREEKEGRWVRCEEVRKEGVFPIFIIFGGCGFSAGADSVTNSL